MMIGRLIAPSARDDVAGALHTGERRRKLRFLMTDNSEWILPGNGRVQRECKNITMRELASSIPNWAMAHVDVPVVDLTDIQGAYDFRMEWSVPANPGAEGRGDVPITTDNGGATLFDAMSQIGLKLERRKHPMSVIVIDHVDRLPPAN